MPPITGWKTGVYSIRNIKNGKRYVGSAAISLEARKYKHKWDLDNHVHCNRHLQGAWDKYGEESFIFEDIERCPPKLCLEREQYWLDYYQAFNPEHGYNFCVVAGSPLGTKRDREAVRKTAEANRGRKISAETRHKISMAKKGKRYSVSERVAKTLVMRDPEVRLKLALVAKRRTRGANGSFI